MNTKFGNNDTGEWISKMANKVKCVSFEIRYTQSNNSCEVKIRKTAKLELGATTTFASIAAFLADWEKCMASYRHCSKKSIFCEAYLSVGIYATQIDGQFTSESFNGWEFADIPEYECDGFYLQPDVRYTNEEHDIWINFSLPLLDQLAEAKI